MVIYKKFNFRPRPLKGVTLITASKKDYIFLMLKSKDTVYKKDDSKYFRSKKNGKRTYKTLKRLSSILMEFVGKIA